MTDSVIFPTQIDNALPASDDRILFSDTSDSNITKDAAISELPISTATQSAIDAVQSDIDTHEARTDNPHSVTKSQVGLWSVDNTSDSAKPISSATQAALDTKIESVVAWTNVTIDNTNPLNPIINSTWGGGGWSWDVVSGWVSGWQIINWWTGVAEHLDLSANAALPTTWYIRFKSYIQNIIGNIFAIFDVNGNENLRISSVASAVNALWIENSVTTAWPEIYALWADANIDINITPKGTGNLKINGDIQSWVNTWDQKLNTIIDPDGSKTFSMGGNTVTWNFTNPTWWMLYNMTGGWSGHILEVMDTSSVPDWWLWDHLLHMETSRLNVLPAHFVNNSVGGRALKAEGITELIWDTTITWNISATNLSWTNTWDNATNTQYSWLAASKEDTANKSTSVTTDQASDTKFPSVKSVYDWATWLFATISNLNLKAPLASPTFTGTSTFDTIKITWWTPWAWKVATSDADWDVTWETPSGWWWLSFRASKDWIITTWYLKRFEMNSSWTLNWIKASVLSLPTWWNLEIQVYKNGTATANSVFTSDSALAITTWTAATNWPSY